MAKIDGILDLEVVPGVLNKSELVAGIADRSGLSKTEAERWFKGLQEVLIQALERGEMVRLTGLFAVERVKRAARTGRNLQTGEDIEIPESWGVKMTVGSMLKNAVK